MIRDIDSAADKFLSRNPQTVDRGAVEQRVAALALGLVKPVGATGKIQVFDPVLQDFRDIAAEDLPGNVFQKVTAVTPLTGATITANATSADELIYITPAGTLAALTFVFPSDANSALGQVLTIISHQTITALTVTSAGLTLRGTAATAMQADVPIRWRKVASATWSREDATLTSTGVVLTSPVITTGMTASGSAANTFAGSTGTFITSTGANTLSGTTTVAANKNLLCATGTTLFDFSLGTGIFKTTTGANTFGGSSNTFTNALTMGTATQGLVLKQGANGLCGTFVCNGSTPVTVNNSNVAISDAIIISLNTVGGTVGAKPTLKTITGGTGFTVAGTASDTSTYNYSIIKNAA